MRQLLRLDQKLDNELKHKLLLWSSSYQEVVWLDSNQIPHLHNRYQAILAVDSADTFAISGHGAFQGLSDWQQARSDWSFGYLGYDLKNDLEVLKSENKDILEFPDLVFFRPKRLFLFTEEGVELYYLESIASEMQSDWEAIQLMEIPEDQAENRIKISVGTTPDQYREKVGKLLEHIRRGDIYEANFCMEFYARSAEIDPISTFNHLNRLSSAPFSTFFRYKDCFALSSSPERFLRKQGDRLISQPIKGTRKRGKDKQEDQKLKLELEHDPKERSENIMITDLVRNDMSKIARRGSVEVDELCQVYSFEQVHQMISTVSCSIKAEYDKVEVIKALFPMGSMTGAPKIRAMEIIEELEDFKRGLYSGTIGYFDPTGDFDFNVIIRTILYNQAKHYLCLPVGSAITAGSNIDQEYAECLLKAKAMREVLE